MDKQQDRAPDLSASYPEFMRGFQELKEINNAEEIELQRLYQCCDGLWADGFIQSATIQGVKRWESLLGIRPYPNDSLTERQAAVLLKWNQQLPYTLLRLQERLEAAVGSGGYELYARYREYILELTVIDQTYRVLQKVHEMTREMIPANLIFLFAGKYPGQIPVDVTVGSGLKFISDFYARYNREFLYLDGTWNLDGTYLLNGYKEVVGLDLYPLELKLRSNLPARNAADSRAFEVIMKAVKEMKVQSGLLLRVSVPMETKIGAHQRIRGHTGITADTKTQMAYRSDAAASSGTWTELILRSEEAAATTTESASRISQQVSAEPEVMCRLSVEKDLWYLDGTYLLDGTKLLDAEIFNYDL